MTNPAINPLDLRYIFYNVFAGDATVALGLAFLAISVTAGAFRMPTRAYLTICILAMILLYNVTSTSGLLLLTIIVASIIIFSNIKKYFQGI